MKASVEGGPERPENRSLNSFPRQPFSLYLRAAKNIPYLNCTLQGPEEPGGERQK